MGKEGGKQAKMPTSKRGKRRGGDVTSRETGSTVVGQGKAGIEVRGDARSKGGGMGVTGQWTGASGGGRGIHARSGEGT